METCPRVPRNISKFKHTFVSTADSDVHSSFCSEPIPVLSRSPMAAEAANSDKEARKPKIEDGEITDSQPIRGEELVDKVLAVLARAVDESRKAVRATDVKTAELEDRYIAATWAHGNLMRGWDGYCRRVDRAPKSGNGSGTATGAPKQRKVRPSDRMFSMTSSSSAIRQENLGAELVIRKGTSQKKKKKR